MARLFTSGHETNSFTSTDWSTISGSPALQTTTKHSGTYAFSFGLAGETTQSIFFERRLNAGVTSGTYYTRWYFYADDRPGADKRIFQARNDASSQIFTVSHLTDGQLRITNQQDSSTSDSGATLLPMDEWVRLELEIVVSSTVGSLTLRMNGTQVAQLTNKNVINSTQLRGFAWGNFGDGGSSDHYWDDHAINDTSESFQNSWPGPGKLAMIKPESDDTVAWTDATGTGTGNAGEVDDSPGASDDDTSYVTSSTANQEDRYNLTALPGEVPSDATIILVNVQTRVRGEGTSSTRQVRALLWDHNGSQTNGPTTNNNDGTTYQTDSTAEQFIFDGTGYTPANINDFDAGIEPVTSHATRLTNLWVYVEWIEAAAGATPISASDSVPIVAVETTLTTARFSTPESAPIATSETLMTTASFRVSESTPLVVSEALLTAITQSVFDALPVTLSEESRIALALSVADACAVVLEEALRTSLLVAAADSLGITVSEATLLLVAATVLASDTVPLGLVEALGTLSVRDTRSDALPLVAAEQVDLDVSAVFTDTPAIVVADALGTIAAAFRLSDLLGLGVDETSRLLVAISTLVDTGVLQVQEAVAMIQAATLAVSDTCRIGLTDAASIAISVAIAAADSIKLGVTEGAPTLVVFLAQTDTAAVGILDALATINVTTTFNDLVVVRADELLEMLVRASAIDVLAINLAEARMIFDPGAGVPLPDVLIATLIPVGLAMQSLGVVALPFDLRAPRFPTLLATPFMPTALRLVTPS